MLHRIPPYKQCAKQEKNVKKSVTNPLNIHSRIVLFDARAMSVLR